MALHPANEGIINMFIFIIPWENSGFIWSYLFVLPATPSANKNQMVFMHFTNHTHKISLSGWQKIKKIVLHNFFIRSIFYFLRHIYLQAGIYLSAAASEGTAWLTGANDDIYDDGQEWWCNLSDHPSFVEWFIGGEEDEVVYWCALLICSFSTAAVELSVYVSLQGM